MLYQTTVQLIEQAEDIPALSSNRATADFFVWVIEHHHKLEERYGQPVLIKDAASDLER